MLTRTAARHSSLRLPRPRKLRQGFALEATLAVLVLIAVLVAAAATGATTMVRTSAVDQSSSRVIYAVDAASDNLMSQLMQVLQTTGMPTQAQLDAMTTPPTSGTNMSGVTISQTARRITAATNDSIRVGAFRGLMAQYSSYDMDIQATDAARNAARAIVRVEAQLIPIFQFGVFFENDLEINPGATFNFLGRVHTNGTMYLCSSASRTYFRDWLTTPNRLILNRKDNNDNNCGTSGSNWTMIDRVTTPRDSQRLRFDSRGTGNTGCCSSPANDNRFRDSSNLRFAGRVQTSAYGVDSLNLPLPTGMDPRALIQPRSGTDPESVKEVKFAWKADWHITVDYNSINTFCDNISTLAPRTGLQIPTNLATCNGIFSRRTFRNDREGRTVTAFQIDIAALNAWVAGDSARRTTNITYVRFINMPALATPAGVSGGSAQPAVRVINGTRLRNPWTLASEAPVYIRGDFNFDRTRIGGPIGNDTTAFWKPASIIADAVTFLGGTFTDADNVSAGSNNRTSDGLLYVRAAICAGHSPTFRSLATPFPSDWFVVGSSTNYGGGLENFPRFLENWGGRTVNFNGSLVSLYYSRIANWSWSGSYYTAPVRQWSFDMRFKLPENLPPGTPKVGSVYQIAYRPVY